MISKATTPVGVGNRKPGDLNAGENGSLRMYIYMKWASQMNGVPELEPTGKLAAYVPVCGILL
jgi:hypothetical protein